MQCKVGNTVVPLRLCRLDHGGETSKLVRAYCMPLTPSINALDPSDSGISEYKVLGLSSNIGSKIIVLGYPKSRIPMRLLNLGSERLSPLLPLLLRWTMM